MAASEALAIERLVRADVEGGLRLSDAARWNQTAEDWAFFVDQGEAFAIRDSADGLVATAAALPYGGGVGWISMVLVDARHRHQGLATRLLGACVDTLRGGGRVPVLDATPDGAAVLCPCCGDYNQHVGDPHVIDGEDDYRAGWGGRGDLVLVPFWGECGSEWDICFGFHKGSTEAFVRVRVPCT